MLQPSSNGQTYQPEHLYFQPIGLLKATWFSSRGKVRAINYGTASLTADRLLLTCAHNIYSQQLLAEADQIQFTHNATNGEIKKGYYCSTQKLVIKRVHSDQTFKLKPKEQELCLILLQTPIQTYSPKIKFNSIQQAQNIGLAFSSQTITHHQPFQIKIVGYPYSKLQPIDQTFIERQQLEGQLCSIEGFIIHHSAKTQQGISGSPILAFDSNNRPYVIGIHTHRRGNNINSGLFFTQKLLLQIQSFVNEINQEFNLSQRIQFVSQSEQNVDSQKQQQTEQSRDCSDQDYENDSEFEVELGWDEFYEQIGRIQSDFQSKQSLAQQKIDSA